MKHFTRISDLGPDGVKEILATAATWKKNRPGAIFMDRILGMVFFNPSLRTRASFEAAMLRHGGHAIVLEVGAGTWKLEDRDGAIMNEDRAEHVREGVPVLGRYADLLAVRTFSHGNGDAEDEIDPVINAFRRFSTVPVLSMESAREHPHQGLADLLTIQEAHGSTKVPVTLTWAPHIKPLPKAVPNSFLLTAAACGADIRVAHPRGYELSAEVRAEAEAYAAATGGKITYTHDQDAARPRRLDAHRRPHAEGRQGGHLHALPAGASQPRGPRQCPGRPLEPRRRRSREPLPCAAGHDPSPAERLNL